MNFNVTNRRFLNLRNVPERNCFIRMDVPRQRSCQICTLVSIRYPAIGWTDNFFCFVVLRRLSVELRVT